MVTRKARRKSAPSLSELFPIDRRDRRPGTHFAAELGSPPRNKRRREDSDPHVDEDLGVSAFGIDLPFLRH